MPQSIDVLNNPLSFTDPSGLFTNGAYCGDSCPDDGGGGFISIFVDIGEAIASLFGGGPSFHGSLHPRPSGTGNPQWDGNFGESLGIGNQIPTGRWGIAQALGLPDAGCEFGACGAGPMNATPGAAVYSAVPYINMQSWQQLLAHLYPWYWFNKGGSNIVPGTHYCGPGGWGSTNGPVDAACYQHDLCYDGVGIGAGNVFTGTVPAAAQAGKAACDQQLCQTTSQNSNYTPDQMAQQFWVSGYFHCK